MVAKRPNLNPLKFKDARKTNTPERRALTHYRPASVHLDDEGLANLWKSLGDQTQQQYLDGYKALQAQGKSDATTSASPSKKKAKKKATKTPAN